uniref:Dual specificity protein phosphatase PHS1 n=1 Tax=Ananas comosus var. bracteatus TaxID=296719 RepID=A0A6V7PG42_ANACO|nr:unnamed protein product [Ananas comosus var. bracteatus]
MRRSRTEVKLNKEARDYECNLSFNHLSESQDLHIVKYSWEKVKHIQNLSKKAELLFYRSYSTYYSAGECKSEEDDANVGSSHSSEQVPELSLWERLGKAAMLDIESNDFSWSSLSSLYHTKHTSSTEPSEDELNKALEVTVNSGGVVFIALFNTTENSDTSPKEAAAVLKFASSRMATQSERLGYEFAKWLGVRTPQARVIHNTSSEWQQIKDATEKARCMAVSNGDEVSETTCSELLDALELSRCLFLMNYIHGSPLLENSTPFDSREAAEKTAEALGKVLMLDLILRNEDRLRCRWLGWRGNYGNLLVTDEEASANMDLLDEVFYDSTVRRYMPEVIRSHQKERRAISVNGRLSSDNLKLTSQVSDSSTELNNRPKMIKQVVNDIKSCDFYIVAIDSGKLDGLLRCLLPLISKFGESDKDDSGASDSPSFSAGCSSTNSPFPACKGNGGSEINVESSDNEIQKLVRRQSHGGSRESFDLASSFSRESWNVRYFRGNGDQNRSLRLTMKLRDFNKFAKVDAELNKELEQWNEMLRTDVIKLCQENNFNTGFFEGSDSNIAIDAYELKVRLEHILERISMISDAASTERPSQITDNLYIGGALAARSMYTLQHLGITHILCLCSNEIGQADSQYPYLFDYRNFSIRDTDDEDISDLFQETSDFIDYVEYLGGKVLVHCFEGRSRSATVVLAYLILRKNLTLLEAWNMLRKVHRRAQPNDGFAKILLDLEERLHGKISMEWQHRRPTMKVCPICGKNAGLSSSSLKLHLQKSHKKISSGSVDSAMTLEIQKAIEALKISRSGSVSPTQKQLQSQSQSFIENLAS